jgi:hypothetical protein
MFRTDEIMSTIQMLHAEHLDVRTVTLGLNVDDCAAPSMETVCRKLRDKILSRASRLVETCDRVGRKYGIPVTNKRIAISPASHLVAGHGQTAAVAIAKTLDEAAAACRVDLVGGFTALVHKGIAPADAVIMASLPEVLSQTKRVCASINVASRRAGINMDAVAEMGRVLLRIADATKAQSGFGCAKLVVFSNIPEDNPFMAGAYVGEGEPEAAVNIGVSGPGVVSSALKRRIAMGGKLTLGDLAEEIKITGFRVTRVGELIGREVAAELGVVFGIVDLSLAPTPEIGDSVGEILRTLGIEKIGAPGSTAAVAMLTDAIKKGGAFASSSVGGMSGAFIPVSEDAALADAAARGHLSLEKRRPRHDRRAGRHAGRDACGDHRRRDGHRRDERQDHGRPHHSRAGGKGGAARGVRRPLRLGCRDGGAEHGGLGPVRPVRRPDSGTDSVAEELVL